MPLAVDGARVAEAAAGVVVLLALVAVLILQWRSWRAKKREVRELGEAVPALARSGPVTVSDPLIFGGGAREAQLRRRRDTVAYGYLAVIEEYRSADSDESWCTLTVNLPGMVPFLSIDAVGTAGPAGTTRVSLGEPDFDAAYATYAANSDTVRFVLVPEAQRVVLTSGMQRLMLRECLLLLRTPPGHRIDDELIDSMSGVASRFLAATPSFVTHDLAGRPMVVPLDSGPLPPGLYGLDEADETHPSGALN